MASPLLAFVIVAVAIEVAVAVLRWLWSGQVGHEPEASTTSPFSSAAQRPSASRRPGGTHVHKNRLHYDQRARLAAAPFAEAVLHGAPP